MTSTISCEHGRAKFAAKGAQRKAGAKSSKAALVPEAEPQAEIELLAESAAPAEI